MADVVITIRGDSRSAEQAAANVRRAMDGATDSAKRLGAVDIAKGIMGAQAVTAAFTKAVDFAKSSVIGFNSTLEQSRIAFTTMSGSAKVAEAHLMELQRFARQTPFDFPTLLDASKRLQAFGITTAEVIPTLESLGNIAAGVGMEKLPQLILAFGQVSAATRLTGTELRQFTEAGVPLLDELAKAYGVSAREMTKFIEDGKVGFDAVKFALENLSSEGGRFSDLMEKQSQTFDGAMSNIRDSLQQKAAKGFATFFDSSRDALVEFAKFLETDQQTDRWASNVNAALASVAGNLAAVQRAANQRFDELMNRGNRLREQMRQLPGAETGVLGPEFLTPSDINFRGGVGDVNYGPMPETPEEKRAREAAARANATPPPLGIGDPVRSRAGGGGSSGPTVRTEPGASADLINQMFAEKNGFDAWRESLRAALMTGEMHIGEVADEFGRAGMTAAEAFREIGRMLDENKRFADDYEKSWSKALDIVAQRKHDEAEFEAANAERMKDIEKERAAEHARMVSERIEREFRAGEIISQRAAAQFQHNMSQPGMVAIMEDIYGDVLNDDGTLIERKVIGQAHKGKFRPRTEEEEEQAEASRKRQAQEKEDRAWRNLYGYTKKDAETAAAISHRLQRQAERDAADHRRAMEQAMGAGSGFASSLKASAQQAVFRSGNPFAGSMTLLTGMASMLSSAFGPIGSKDKVAAARQASMQRAYGELGAEYGFNLPGLTLMVNGDELGRIAGGFVTQRGSLAARVGVL